MDLIIFFYTNASIQMHFQRKCYTDKNKNPFYSTDYKFNMKSRVICRRRPLNLFAINYKIYIYIRHTLSCRKALRQRVTRRVAG
ncbi:hypothetical protein BIY28_18845 [Brenneria goodwinii]|nr:hypothetical protein BIY28_18845 [Brenneria goodwinii]